MRPTKDETWLAVASVIAERGTCARRRVGCVLVNSLGHVLSTGYNGVANSLPHCTDNPCPGASHASGSGTSLYLCEAIHAEQNALLQCQNVQEIDTCYVTCSPCVQCTKLLLQTSCKRVVFLEESSHNKEARKLWFARHPPSMDHKGDWHSSWIELHIDTPYIETGLDE